MQNCIRFVITVFVSCLLVLNVACKKENPDDNPIERIPSIITDNVSSITQTSAICGGNIVSNGGAEIINMGICWSTSENPTIYNHKTTSTASVGSFQREMQGLSHSTTYYVRAYVSYENGVKYGNTKVFTTLEEEVQIETVTDIDGNVYNTVQIGNQIWMKENLKTTKYRDGINISFPGSDNGEWVDATIGAYAWYNNNINNKENYGALYNWYAVNSGKLCPQNWHVPSDSEWETLVNNLGGTTKAGGKLKAIGFEFWNSPNKGANNEKGFTALPGGHRDGYTGAYDYMGTYGYWWSSSTYNATDAWFRDMMSGSEAISRGHSNKKYGFSVRCLKGS